MKFSPVLILVTIFGLIAALPGSALAQQSQPSGNQGTPLCGKNAPGVEKHPEMCKALGSLRRAKKQLENSAHDYNGLRVKALQETQQAIDDVIQAIKSDQQ